MYLRGEKEREMKLEACPISGFYMQIYNHMCIMNNLLLRILGSMQMKVLIWWVERNLELVHYSLDKSKIKLQLFSPDTAVTQVRHSSMGITKIIGQSDPIHLIQACSR